MNTGAWCLKVCQLPSLSATGQSWSDSPYEIAVPLFSSVSTKRPPVPRRAGLNHLLDQTSHPSFQRMTGEHTEHTLLRASPCLSIAFSGGHAILPMLKDGLNCFPCPLFEGRGKRRGKEDLSLKGQHRKTGVSSSPGLQEGPLVFGITGDPIIQYIKELYITI